MLTKDQFREMLVELLKKSRKNLVNWRRGVANQLVVHFPSGAVISVAMDSPSSEPDLASATMRINGEDVVRLDAEEGLNDFQFLRELFIDARRCVGDWDTAIDEVMRQLQSAEKVGVSQKSEEQELEDAPF